MRVPDADLTPKATAMAVIPVRHPIWTFSGESAKVSLSWMHPMNKLPEVEQAKMLMTEAMVWSVMKWLREKKTVRKTADQADAALDQLDEKTKARWNDALKSAYASLGGSPSAKRTATQPQKKPASSEVLALAKKIKHADDEAYRARMDAEKTFDDAEKQLSTSLAREGCRKAIHGWELHEKAIALAESAV